MNKNIIVRTLLLGFIFLVPFRMAFLEYPVPAKINNISVDGGGILYCFAMLATVLGSILVFYFTSKEKTAH